MPDAKIKVNGREITIGDGVTTFGRASDNTVSFAEDSNVSRYHAEIEKRGEDFWLIDLGSSNGTTLAGLQVNGEKRLTDGDRIAFGGTSVVEFEIVKEDKESLSPNIENAAAVTAEDEFQQQEEELVAEETEAASQSNKTLMIAGGAVGLAVVFAVAAGAIYYSSGSSCDARAVIVKPEPGDTIIAATEIEVESQNTGCVASAVFTIDGVEFAATEEQPFTATLDPKEFPDLSDGFEHNLQIVLIGENGEKIVQPGPILLAFETREIAKPSPEIVQTNTQQQRTQGKQVSLIEVQEMSKRLIKQFPGNFSYNVSNKQFLQEVQKRTGEFAQAGYFERAAPYRDAINVAYVREQNLDAALGFILAMSRSKFVAAKQGDEEGLWKMSSPFVTANAYNGLCGSESLSDASQNCAAKASALYLKAIVFGVFDGDVIYSAAAFGKSPQDAGVWKASLPQNRADIWNTIKTPAEREQIVRFFAAGIVAENPQKFGLAKDKPLSELYRLTM